MKLLRYGPPGEERPALVDADGRLRDLAFAIGDITPATIGAGCLDIVRGLEPGALPPVTGSPRLGPPILAPQKFIGIGLNYADHAAEVGMDKPAEPVVFTKHVTCICGPDDDVVLPRFAEKADWEVELGVVIGKVGRDVPESRALRHVAGYLLVNDVSERAVQLEGTGQWVKGKSFDTFGPIGPWLVTPDELPDPQAVDLELRLNGEIMQRGTTASMFFSVAELISYLSRHFTLMPGDIIATGTPAGVGHGRTPPRRDGAGRRGKRRRV
ncbi:MAG TPA: FAA hydrolase family protein, partial [Thermopetrobacter sp.]|nr:FAA hydrolase family protein [Thermopetrobacter sp.]